MLLYLDLLLLGVDLLLLLLFHLLLLLIIVLLLPCVHVIISVELVLRLCQNLRGVLVHETSRCIVTTMEVCIRLGNYVTIHPWEAVLPIIPMVIEPLLESGRPHALALGSWHGSALVVEDSRPLLGAVVLQFSDGIVPLGGSGHALALVGRHLRVIGVLRADRVQEVRVLLVPVRVLIDVRN